MDPQESRKDAEGASVDGAAGGIRLSKSDDKVSKKMGGQQQEIEEYTTDGTDCTVVDKSADAETLERATSNKKKRNRKRRSRRVVELVTTSDPETQPASREEEAEVDVPVVAISKSELTTVKEEQDSKEPEKLVVGNPEDSPAVVEEETLPEPAGGNGPLFDSQEALSRSLGLGSTRSYHPESDLRPLKVEAGPGGLEVDGNKAIQTSYYRHVGQEETEVKVPVQEESKEDVGSDENGNKPEGLASSSNDGLGVEGSESEVLKKKKKRNRNKNKNKSTLNENVDSNVGSVDEGQQRLETEKPKDAFGGEDVNDGNPNKVILPKPEITIHTLLSRAKDHAMFDRNSEIQAAPFLLTDDVMDNIAKHTSPEYNYNLKEQLDARMHAVNFKEVQAKVEAATLSQCRQLSSENCNLESQLLMHRLQAAQKHKNTYGAVKAQAVVGEDHIITRPEAENMGLMTEHETLDEIEVVQEEVLEGAVSEGGLKLQSEETLKTEEAVLAIDESVEVQVVQEKVLEEAVSQCGLKSPSKEIYKSGKDVVITISSAEDESLGKIEIGLIDQIDYEDPTPALSCCTLKREIVEVQVHAECDIHVTDDEVQNKMGSVVEEPQVDASHSSNLAYTCEASESKHARDQSVETLKYVETVQDEEVIAKNETATEATSSQISEVSLEEFTSEERQVSLSHDDQSEEKIHTLSERIPLPSGIALSQDDQRDMTKSGACGASSTQDRRGPLRGEHGPATSIPDSTLLEAYGSLSEDNLKKSWWCFNFMRSRSKPKRETSAEVENPKDESRTRSKPKRETSAEVENPKDESRTRSKPKRETSAEVETPQAESRTRSKPKRETSAEVETPQAESRTRSKPKRETSAEVETHQDESRTRSRTLKERFTKRLSLSKH